MPRLSALAFSLGAYGGIGRAAGGGSGGVSTVVKTFVGTSNFIVPTGVTELEYLIVAGGGGSTQGGGGAGGLRFGTGLKVTAGQTLLMNIGAGGSGGIPATSPDVPNPYPLAQNGVGSFIQGNFDAPIAPITHIGTNGGGYGASRQEGPQGSVSYGGAGGSGGGSGSDRNDAPTTTRLNKSLTLTAANGHPGNITGDDVTRGAITQGFDG